MAKPPQSITKKLYAICEYEVWHPEATQKQIADAVNVCYETVCTYRKSDIYRDLRDKLLRDKWREGAKVAMQTMQRLAAEGDREAAKFCLQTQGYEVGSKQKIEASVDNNIVIEIGGDSDGKTETE